MAQNWDRDPHTGDYKMEKGAPIQTNSLLIPAYHRLKVKRTQWLYAPDPGYGSDFYLVKKRANTNANTQLENIAERALQPMVDDGRANTITVTVDANTRNGAGMTTKIVDAQGEVEQTTFKGLGL